MTIRNDYDKITFVAENGTENYRTKAYFRGRRGGGQSLRKESSKEQLIRRTNKNL